MAWIYLITNDVNNKQYIGKTYYDNIQKRWEQHLKDYNKLRYEKRPLYDAMKKYGIEHFHIEEIEYVQAEVNLEEREIYWISQYNTYHNGYNATKGGDGKSYLEYDKLINAYQELGSLKAVCDKYHCDSHHLSKILKSFNVAVKTSEQVNKYKPENQINQYDKQNNLINSFPSAKAAAEYLQIKGGHAHIIEVCKGRRKTAYGYIWRYANK